MKMALIAALVLGSALSSACVDDVKKELNGTWVVKSGEIGGNKLPEEMSSKMKLTIKDNTFETVVMGRTDEGDLKIDTDSKPMSMDITITKGSGKGTTLKCIFKLENDELIVCYAVEGDRPDKFETDEKNKWLLLTYKKQIGEIPKEIR